MNLESFADPAPAVVIGSSGGIGAALAGMLAASPAFSRVITCGRRDAELFVDLEDEASIAAAAAAVRENGQPALVIVATGILHEGERLQPEKRWQDIDAASMQRAFAINTTGPALVARHFLPILRPKQKSVFAALSARVGSISDNRLGGWISYRASKAALNMVIKTLSIELARRHKQAIIVGLHPGTVDTSLSSPFQANVPEGKLFTPQHAAERLLSVLDGLSVDDSGRVFAWDGAAVPP
ncbi:MAG: SDR family NAD(P)-dependent oxidoreductase [Gammaproteobacteria bacterium]|nr:SDR family NAD(P)-dependent oxidoreductase [Gammaproteobacteria bacterium]